MKDLKTLLKKKDRSDSVLGDKIRFNIKTQTKRKIKRYNKIMTLTNSNKGNIMTKAYTLSLLIREVSSLTASQTSTFSSFVDSVSPRAGAASRKVAVLNNYVGGQLQSLISGRSGVGASARTRVLNALRARKRAAAAGNSSAT